MKSIVTKYFGPGNVRGSRIIAEDGDRNRVILGYDDSLNNEQNHRLACEALMRKMNWKGRMIGGWLRSGQFCWVWEDEELRAKYGP